MRVRASYSAILLAYYDYILKKRKEKLPKARLSSGSFQKAQPKWITLNLIGKAKGI